MPQITEAAEVLFDHGDSGVYSATCEELQRQLAAEAEGEVAAPEAAPTPAAAAALKEGGGGTSG